MQLLQGPIQRVHSQPQCQFTIQINCSKPLIKQVPLSDDNAGVRRMRLRLAGIYVTGKQPLYVNEQVLFVIISHNKTSQLWYKGQELLHNIAFWKITME